MIPFRCFVTVHGFKGSGVQGSILVHEVHLDSVFIRKASASSRPIQNLELNWQLFGKMSIFNDDFGSSIPSLSLTLVCDSARPGSLFWSTWQLRWPEAALTVEPCRRSRLKRSGSGKPVNGKLFHCPNRHFRL